MSRSFTPPSTLSKDEIRTIADVRRDIWTSSFYGLGVGSLTGIAAHSLAQFGSNRNWFKLALNRNTAMASFFLGGAIGSFIMATTTGKNEVHQLHPIFDVGARPPPTSYHESLKRARDRELELRTLERRRTSIRPNVTEDRVERERNRLLRRATLTTKLTDHKGLSDAHGGHWVDGPNK